MMNISPDLMKSFSRLRANNDFAAVLDWLVQERANAVDRLIGTSNTSLVHQQQGYAQALTDITRAAMSVPLGLPPISR